MGEGIEVREARRERLQQLRDRYLAVNMRSRSVRLYGPTASGALDLYRMKQLRPAAYATFVDRLGTEYREPIPIIRIQPSEQAESALASNLGVIARHAHDVEMETGARELAVGWPFLEGRTEAGIWLRAPLFLYPVTISTTTSGRVRWTVTFEGLPDINVPLLQLLERLIGIRLRYEDFLEADEDGLFKIDRATWASLVEVFQQGELPFSEYNAELPDLEPLNRRTREEREELPKGFFSLHNHLVLGRFPRWGSTVVKDYEELIGGTLDDNSLGMAVDLLLVDENEAWQETPSLEDEVLEEASPRREGEAPEKSQPRRSGKAPEEEALPLEGSKSFRQWQVLTSDASQDAVFRFLEGSGQQGLVVQGPPGTGKSQLITNLIAAAVGAEKTVLLVCQKRAALDVVADRLTANGLGEPVAVVHDVERDRNDVCASIASTLQRVLSQPLDTSDLHQTQDEAQQQHEDAVRRLESRLNLVREAHRFLTESQDGKLPLAQLQEKALEDDGRPLPDLLAVAQNVTLAGVREALPQLESFAGVTQGVAKPHPLSERKRWNGVAESALSELFDTVDRAVECLEALAACPANMSPKEASSYGKAWEAAGGVLDMIVQAIPKEIVRFRFFWVWTQGDLAHGEWYRVVERLTRASQELGPVPPDLVKTDQEGLEGEIKQLERLEELNSKWYRVFTPEWWQLKKLPETLCRRCGVKIELAESLPELRALCEEAIRWMELIADLPIDMPFMDVGLQGDPADIDLVLDGLKARHDQVGAVHTLYDSLKVRGGPYGEWPSIADVNTDLGRQPLFSAALADRQLSRLYEQFLALCDRLSGYLREELMARIRREVGAGEFDWALGKLKALRETRAEGPEAVKVDRLLEAQPDWLWEFLRQWRAETPGATFGVGRDVMQAMERAWLHILLEGRPPQLLEAPLVDANQLEQLSAELRKMRDLAGPGVLARYHRRIRLAASQRAQGLTLRKLMGEALAKRRRLTLRQLVEGFWNAGLALVRPAWFCSPESIAALFPLEPGLFDLVIFDEASQCPVEAALPALVRAKQAIVAGDDQQMPPSHFFQASLNDDSEEEEESLLASESILTLARVTFQNTTLRWHYRSRHEELVAFSNSAFYGRRLITAPQAEEAQNPLVEGLNWVQVEGQWRDQTNEVEARQVVSLVGELLEARTPEGHPPSIGVVTFNRKQAALIQASIDLHADEDPRFQAALARERKRSIIDQLFVRNIENVQGDERDVIVFSLGYAPAEPGGRLYARFGPLGQAGGEKRLNVAITRAKYGIWVISSFDPDGLNVSSATHDGPGLFKLYLQFVRASAKGAPGQEVILDEAMAKGQGRGVTGVPVTFTGGATRRVGQGVLEQLEAALRQRGLRVQRSLGLGSQRLDMAVGVPGEKRWRLGIDCCNFLHNQDDLARDVFTPRFWRRMGWMVLRVTPSMWLERRDEFLAQIEKKVG